MGQRGRALCALVGSSALGTVAALGTACITPPPEWVEPPPQRPFILDDQVRPPLDEFLQELPPTLVIPVVLADPQDIFYFSAFLDYDPFVDTPPFRSGRVVTPTAEWQLTIDAPTIPSDGRCHRLDVIVAHNFATLLDGATLNHTPDSVGGDQVGWFVAPSGNPSSCFGFDAGRNVGQGGVGTVVPEGAAPEGAASP